MRTTGNRAAPAAPAFPAAPVAPVGRAVFIGCSARKVAGAAPMPAVARYDGPAWRTLRTSLPAAPDVRVIVLSARHGVIAGDERIDDYHARLCEAGARDLAADRAHIARLAELVAGVGEIYLAGGHLYRRTMQVALRRAGFRGVVTVATAPRGNGDVMAGLRRFLVGAVGR
jgi:hypothetical protein